jgi:hypothetical protein
MFVILLSEIIFKFQIRKTSASHIKTFLDIIRNVLPNNEILICMSCRRKLDHGKSLDLEL